MVKELDWYAKSSGINSHKFMGLDLLKDFVSEMLNAYIVEWGTQWQHALRVFRLNTDACKTTQAYDTMEKRHATYPNMLWIAWLPRKRHIFKRLVTAKLNELLDIVLDDLLRMSEGKEHATSLDDLKDTISNLTSCWNQRVGGSSPLRRTIQRFRL